MAKPASGGGSQGLGRPEPQELRTRTWPNAAREIIGDPSLPPGLMEVSERLGEVMERLEGLLTSISGSSARGVPGPVGMDGRGGEAPSACTDLDVLREEFLAQVAEFRATEMACFRQYEAYTNLIHVLQLEYPLPPARGWAASPDLLLRLYVEVRKRRPKTVVEVGSGVSTLVIADALRANGAGRLVSLEHEARYASQVSERIVRQGLADAATVYHAPLAPWTAPNVGDHPAQAWRWYDLAALEPAALASGVDLVFIDGPPGRIQRWSRYPAMPVLRRHLHDGSLVLLDDAIRQEERDIAAAWARDCGMSLEIDDHYEKGLATLEVPREEGARVDALCHVDEDK